MTERIENAQWDNETEMAKVKNIANNWKTLFYCLFYYFPK